MIFFLQRQWMFPNVFRGGNSSGKYTKAKHIFIAAPVKSQLHELKIEQLSK